MLFLRVNKKQEPGDTIALTSSGETALIEAEAIADQPITSLQVIINGQAVEAAPKIDGKTARLSVRVPVTAGSWIAARCTEEDRLLTDAELNAYTLGGQQNEEPTRLRYAHTSPVCVTVEGKGPRVAASIAEAEKMLEAFERFASQGAAEEYRADILAAITKARQVLSAPEERP
jgi:hypothetical protein